VALAHVPTLEPEDSLPGDVVAIPSPDVSAAVYGYLTPEDGGDLYAFTVSSSVTRTVGLIVPAWEEHEDFRPELYVQAPGHRPISARWPDGPLEEHFEPFSLASFWWGPELEVGLTPGQRYVVRVDPGDEAQSGRYVLVFDGPEDVSPSSLRDLPAVWFGAYGGAPQRFNPLIVVPVVVVFGLVGALGALARRLMRS
jgi:hypothetical protein